MFKAETDKMHFQQWDARDKETAESLATDSVINVFICTFISVSPNENALSSSSNRHFHI